MRKPEAVAGSGFPCCVCVVRVCGVPCCVCCWILSLPLPTERKRMTWRVKRMYCALRCARHRCVLDNGFESPVPKRTERMALRMKKMDCANMRKGTLSASLDSLKVILSNSKQYYPHLVHLSTTGLWSHHQRVEVEVTQQWNHLPCFNLRRPPRHVARRLHRESTVLLRLLLHLQTCPRGPTSRGPGLGT